MLTDALIKAPIDRLDAEILLAYVLKKDRSWLIAHANSPLSSSQKESFETLCNRRKNHEPVAYIVGEKEFYGRKFIVDERVLIPRPSTETLIDIAKKFFAHPLPCSTPQITEADTEIVILAERLRDSEPEIILDIGTGSGCIGITLALEIPDIKIICTDISEDALEVAKINAKLHNVLDRITFINTPFLLSNLQAFKHNQRADNESALRFQPNKPNQPNLPNQPKPFLLTSNPPYIPANNKLPNDVSDYEPHEALFAGKDGMEVLLPLWKSAKDNPDCVGIVLECRKEQADNLFSAL